MPSRTKTLLSIVVLGAALVSAPSGSLGGGSDGGIRLPAEFEAYGKWAQLLKEPHPVPYELFVRCMAPTSDDWAAARKKYGPHSERYIRVYANQAVVDALSKRQRGSFPQGATIAKEKLTGDPHGAPVGIAFMVKREKSEFPDTDGWEFLYFPPSGDARKTHAACASCHRAAASTDYVFGQYPQTGVESADKCSVSAVSISNFDFPSADSRTPLQTPLIELWIADDGTVKNSKLLRSSNVKSWNLAILKTVKRWRFSEAPGCGLRKTKASVDIRPY